MPTYEYACTACGHRLDAVQKFTDDALTTCPECGGALRKVYGAVGIAFKGSGFYKTDSRSGSASSNGESKKSADTTSTPGETSSGTSESGTKTETSKPSSDGGGSGEGRGTKESTPAAAPAV